MPVFFSYLLKLSLSLSVVYLFYRLVLRRLTFYNWNRFYLLCYTLLSFFIPFINITPVLEKNEMTDSRIIRFIPNVGTISSNISRTAIPGKRDIIKTLTTWDWLLIVFAAGIAIMLLRLLIQLVSFRKIINRAKLISGKEIKLYQVNEPVIPFSFGRSIFLNRQLHDEAELKEIIRHEFVHVKQRHTLDILWAELLCIVNWYNPFIWLTRKAMRQNLEFIADNKVLQAGINKKQYQYLLLKVVGNNHFSIAQQFNFSSLKKRIAMMNKMKSTRVHLLKFLFLLPLLAILILSFRSIKHTITLHEKEFNISGIVYDSDSKLPLAGVLVTNNENGIKTKTDEKGFYSLAFPLNEKDKGIQLKLLKEGYKDAEAGLGIGDGSAPLRVILVGIAKLSSQNAGNDVSSPGIKDEKGNIVSSPDYEFIKKKFEKQLEQERLDERINRTVEGSEKPIWIIDGVPYAIGKGMKAWFDKEEVEQSPAFRVWVDGNIMTMEEANRTVKRSSINSVGAWSKETAKKYLNVGYNLLLLGINREFDHGKEENDNKVKIAGLVLDAKTLQPLAFAKLGSKGADVLTDEKGYFTMEIPIEKRPLHFVVTISKQGYQSSSSTENWGNFSGKSLEFFGLVKNGEKGESFGEIPAEMKGIEYDNVISSFERWKFIRQAYQKTENKTWSSNDTLPVPVAKWDAAPTASQLDFMKRHPKIERIGWGYLSDVSYANAPDKELLNYTFGRAGDMFMIIYFSNRKWEIYNVNRDEDIKKFKKNYGEAPPQAPEKPVVAVDGRNTDASLKGPSGPSILYPGLSLKDSILCFIDGKEIEFSELEKLNPETIQSINVLKNDTAISKYGKRGKNGVIEIVLKPSSPKKEVNLKLVSPDEKQATAISPAKEVKTGSREQVTGTYNEPEEITVVGKPTKISLGPAKKNDTIILSVVNAGKERRVLAVIKKRFTDAELKNIRGELKARGYDLKIGDIKYDNGMIVFIAGTISKGAESAAFYANNFSEVIAYVTPAGKPGEKEVISFVVAVEGYKKPALTSGR